MVVLIVYVNYLALLTAVVATLFQRSLAMMFFPDVDGQRLDAEVWPLGRT